MQKVPRHVQEAVKRYDRNLRVRWSYERGQYCVERKVPTNVLLPLPAKTVPLPNGGEMTIRLPEYSDKYVSYHAGYLPIFYTPYLDRRMFIALHSSDSHRFGRYYLRKLREFEELDAKLKAKKQAEKLMDVSGEAYDRIAWAQGRRMGMAA